MLTTALHLISSAMISQFTFGVPLPTSEDHLSAPPGERRVSLLLDVSGSMLGNEVAQPCVWFSNNYARAGGAGIPGDVNPFTLTKMEQLKAALVGCITPNDGFLDIWARQLDIGITVFGLQNGNNYAGGPSPGANQHLETSPQVEVRTIRNFTRNLTTLENDVLALDFDGWTPMEWGLLEAGRSHNVFFTNGPGRNTCDQHFVILMTDGIPNDCTDMAGNGGMFDNGTPCPTPVASYNHVPCGAGATYIPSSPDPLVGPFNPVPAAAYYHYDLEFPDAVCSLDGNQNITTYVIGFGQASGINPTILSAIAAAGGGQYHYAADTGALSAAFNSIANAIVARSGHFVSPSVQSDGLFVGNHAYSGSFKAVPGRPWIGNLKAYCVVPDLLPSGAYADEDSLPSLTSGNGRRCLFYRPRTTAPLNLVNNPRPFDRWSTTNLLEADIGGAGFAILRDYYNGRPPLFDGDLVPTTSNPAAFAIEFGNGTPAYFGRRQILTWTSPTSGFVPVHSLTDRQMLASNCARTRLLSYLHGYDHTTVDCVANAPRALATWPLGASVAGVPTILRWGANCHSAANQCLVAINMDDGGVHFFDTFDGREHSVIIPKELFTPGDVGNYPLAQILDQPNAELTRRPYNNGGMMLIHDDRNGDGIIAAGEPALLTWGLGYGGAAYYFMDVNTPFTIPDATDNPIYPVLGTKGTWAEHMSDAVARPYIARVSYDSAQPPVLSAVVASGHVWYTDRPSQPFNSQLTRMPETFDPDPALSLCPGPNCSRYLATCQDFVTYNGYQTTDLDPCTELVNPLLNYDAVVAGNCANNPRDVYTLPLWYGIGAGPGARPAGAVGQFTFNQFSLQPGDWIQFEDLNGNPVSPQITGVHPPPFTVDVWITSRPFRLRFHADGNCAPSSIGLQIESIQWIPDRLFGGCTGGNPCEACDDNENGGCELAECGTGQPNEDLTACRLCDLNASGHCSNLECATPVNNMPVTPAGGTCRWCDFNGDGNCVNTANECQPLGPHDCSLCDVAAPANGQCLLADNECAVANTTNLTCVDRHPYLAFIDLSKINGPARVPFANTVTNGDSIPLLFTRVCPAGFLGTCYDQISQPDLANMVCPIVAEVRAVEEGGVAKAFYVGDQCGRMWKFFTNNNGDDWTAKVLFNVNNLLPLTAGRESKDYRHFDRPVDLAFTQCRGNQSVAVYFGTGNVARPGAIDNLSVAPGDGSALTNITGLATAPRSVNRNILGTFFDSGQWDTGPIRTLADFEDLTPLNPLNPPTLFTRAGNGWFFGLNFNEQMLRDPLVFQGRAFYKTNQTTAASVACRPGTTIDRVYAVDNCTAAPANGGATSASREAWSGYQDGGGGLFLYVPEKGPALVSVGTDSTGQPTPANVVPPPPQSRRSLKLYMFQWGIL